MPPPARERIVERHSRASVTAAALDLLDRRGLPGLSMRAIAESLGIQVSALYWHFPDKQTLLAGVSARILAPPAEDATEARDLAATATALRDRLLAHRDGAELVSSSLALGLIEPAIRADLVAAAAAAGLDDPGATAAADTVVHYVIGHAFHEQQRRHAAEAGVLSARAGGLGAAEGSSDPAEDFAAGLDFIVSGIRAVARRGPGPTR